MPGALDGIRILDLSAVVSGPMAVQMLADQGADVIKVEQPGAGDIARFAGAQRGGVSSLFAVLNRNKRSIVIDMRVESARAVMMDLIAGADVLVQNFRPGATDRMGLGYAQLKDQFPNLIYVSISGFGADGPYAGRRVYDPVIQGVTGFVATQKQSATGLPELIKNLVCDKSTALTAAQAMTAALFARERGHGGQHVEVSMLDAGLSFLWPDGMWNETFTGDGVQPMPSLGDIYRVTKTRDGFITYIVVSDPEWQGMCRAMGKEDMGTDPKFATLPDRIANIDELIPFLDRELGQWQTEEICARLEAEQVPFARINPVEEVVQDPQVVHRKSVVRGEHPHAGPLQMPAPPARFAATPSDIRYQSPMLGEHTDEILGELGRDADTIKKLRADGAVS